MPYNKIPNTFLKLPELSNAHRKPEEPYQYSTLGMIHTSKFKELCRVVIEKIHPIPPDILELFKGHRFEGIIDNLEFDELADIIRHTLIINKDKIGWEIVDEVNYALTDYIPRWELPDLYFDKGLREVFISRVNWNPVDSVRQTMQLFIEEYRKFFGEEIYKDQNIDPMTQKIWSFKELYLLLNELTYFISSHRLVIQVETYQPLANALFRQFEENYKNKIYDLEQRISLIFLAVKSSIGSGIIDIDRLQILLDNSMALIKQLEPEQETSYRLLYGFIYSIFWFNLFTSTSDLIMQRDLVAEIIEDIYKPENMDLISWGNYIVSSKPHPLVLSLLLSGYIRLEEMIYNYAESLPSSSQQTRLIRIRNELMEFMDLVKNKYLTSYFDIKFDQWDFTTQFKLIEEKIPFVNIHRLFKRIVVRVSKFQIIKNPSLAEEEKILNSYKELVHNIFATGIAEMEYNELLILTKQYKYDFLFEIIQEEFNNATSIILSSTFETEIIQKLGNIFHAIQEKNKLNGVIDIREYEIMVLFTLNWMMKLYNDPSIRYEVIMILSPLISIAYIQIAKGYLDKNNLEGAFLSYFNSYYLMEMVNQDLKGYSTGGGGKDKSLGEKFQSLLGEWGIEDLSDEESIKKLFNNIEHSIKDRTMNREDKSFSMGGMLDDDIVIGYLDIITQLESFHQLVETSSSIRSAVIESEIFEVPPEEKIFRSDYLGYTLDERLFQQFPFPVIRNIGSTSIGIKLYPIELKMPEEQISFENKPRQPPSNIDRVPNPDE